MSQKTVKSRKLDRIVQKNGFTKRELDILRAFLKEPWKQFSIAEIKNIVGSKSQNFVFNALKSFAKRNILKEEQKGRVNLYSIEFESEESIEYAAITENAIKEERTDIPSKSLKKITDNIKSPFYSLLVGGSYAGGTQKPASDIDIALIIPDCEDKKAFEAALNRGELILPEVHGFVFTREEFYLMLVNKEYNYGKEIAKKHVIIYGAEAYYKILFEAMKYGFKG